MLKYFLIALLVMFAIAGVYGQEINPSVITPSAAAPAKSNLVYVVPIKGEIMDRGIAYFVRHSVQKAKENNAALIIFEIDTPGGAVGAGDEYTMGICKSIEEAGPVPTVAYVLKWAWSAGSLISISADKIVMKSGSSIGSAEVIAGGADMAAHQEKFTSALRAQFKATAEKGYPPYLAMAMVDKDMEVREVFIEGKRQFLTPDEIQELSKTNKIEEGRIISAKGKLLNLTANDAVEFGFATAIKETRAEIPPIFNITNARFVEVTPTWSEILVMYITHPAVVSVLVLLGLLAGYLAYQTPGTGLFEALAIACFALVFFGQYLVGLAEVTEILLFVLGAGLLAVEIFLVPGFGIFGIAGIALMVLGLILSMQGFTIPDVKGAPWQVETLEKNLIVVGLSFTFALVAIIIFIKYISAVPFFNKLILTSEVNSGQGFIPQGGTQSGAVLVGKKGLVFSTLRPAGKIDLLDANGKTTGQTIDAVTEGEFIDKGATVVVIEIDGSRIVVEKAAPFSNPPSQIPNPKI